MRRNFNLLLFLILLMVLQSCNTLYNFSFAKIEVVEPALLLLPEKYQSAAVVYNNANADFKPKLSQYVVDTLTLIDVENTDSIASKIYYSSFIDNLKKQFFFDSILVLQPVDYYQYSFSDTLIQNTLKSDSTALDTLSKMNSGSFLLAQIIKTYQNTTDKYTKSKNIDPLYGLFSKDEIKKIADSTRADLLISLDYFTTSDKRIISKANNEYYAGNQMVYSFAFWNFYDLNKQEPLFCCHHFDTLGWEGYANYSKELDAYLPPRKDAIYNAAEMSGENITKILIPHWIEVKRLYYISGQVDLKPTAQMIKEGKWKEAAELWKKGVDNPNQNIAAKCMYNLGVACEMAGDFDAALDWVVKSYHIFGNKNEVHAENCMDYIRILGQRKMDLKKIEKQLNPPADSENRP